MQRSALSSEAVLTASRIINEKIIQAPIFVQAQHIAYYVSHENEVDLSLMATRALSLKKSLYLPRMMQDQTMQFVRVDAETVYEKNRFGIVEPQSNVVVNPELLTLMFVPLVAFDDEGNRCGRGVGYYDRYLSHCRQCYLIGVGYAFQKVSRLVSETWDIPMDCIITETSDFR